MQERPAKTCAEPTGLTPFVRYAMRRRKLLKATGAAAFAGLAAGCIGEGPGAGGGETDTEAPTATASPTETGTTEPEGTTNETDTQTGTEDGDLLDIDGEIGDTPDNLEVTNHELYQTNGEVGLRGTIQNVSDQAYGHVEAEVTLQDDQGDILYEFIDETEEESVPQLEAGNEWQFDVVFEEAQMSEVTEYTIDVNGYPVTDADFGDITEEVNNQDKNVKILTSSLTREESQTVVVGAIKNVSEEPVENVEVNVTLYDDNDKEVSDFTDTVEEEEGSQQMVPGQIWYFRVDIEDVDMQNIGRYVVTVESSLA